MTTHQSTVVSFEEIVSLFLGCKTQEEGRKLYRRLAIQHHPDRGGSEEAMKIVNHVYNLFLDGRLSHPAPSWERTTPTTEKEEDAYTVEQRKRQKVYSDRRRIADIFGYDTSQPWWEDTGWKMSKEGMSIEDMYSSCKKSLKRKRFWVF